MTKKIKYSTEAREQLKLGFDALANAVGSTLGPYGRNVIIENNGKAIITKDGVSVAKEIYLEDNIQNLGAQMIKEVSLNTNKQAGDGTTTATVLAQAILELGFQEIEQGRKPIDIKRELDEQLKYILGELDNLSEDIKDDYERLFEVATISTNGDKGLAKLLIDLIKENNDTNILLNTSDTSETYTEFIEGMSFDTSYIDSYFINVKDRRECILKNPVIFIYNGKLKSSKDLINILEYCNKINKPLVIFTEEASQDVILTLLRNKQNDSLESVIIKSPGFGPGRQEALSDIAIMTGSEVIREGNIKDIIINDLGTCEEIIVTEDKTIIKNGGGSKEEINNRILDLESIKSKYDDHNKSKIEQRISKYKGGIGVINIGANSELEYKEKYDRIEDAVNAIRAAIEEGIVSGGGTTLYKIANAAGSKMLIDKAIERPYIKIKENSGITKYNCDLDYRQYLKQGIIDPKKVTRIALENAVSVAGTILTTECVIVNK